VRVRKNTEGHTEGELIFNDILERNRNERRESDEVVGYTEV